MSADLVLVVRRTIAASAEFLFDAWTKPEHLRAWWGPAPVRCVGAEVDLRVGGRYRIVNRLPDGSDVVISGEFLAVEPPRRLEYTWLTTPGGASRPERVTVRFEAAASGTTEVIVTHTQIGDRHVYESHQAGWDGCLERLARYPSGH